MRFKCVIFIWIVKILGLMGGVVYGLLFVKLNSEFDLLWDFDLKLSMFIGLV